LSTSASVEGAAPPAAGDAAEGFARQHLIDPEICIRCNTCEATCPVGAITHDERNYVVRFEVCQACNACISPCPTGAIDNWRQVRRTAPYSLDDQYGWDSLPADAPLAVSGADGLPDDVALLTTAATAGQGGAVAAPWSAERPSVALYAPGHPAHARVAGNFRLTDDGATSDIRHVVLDFGATAFPVLEGQSVGIQPPGADAQGRPHALRLYSVASPRDGERPGYNNLSLTVKRVRAGFDGAAHDGLCSNYVCDLKPGDEVRVVGPYGASFLMPNHPGANLLMICTGTGSAPMRAMTERRRRRRALGEGGRLMLFFGARSPAELPYFGPLMKLPREFIDINFAFSRVPGQQKQYVQDRIRERAADVARLLSDEQTYVYVCGLKGMEAGVDEALRSVCLGHALDWSTLLPALRAAGRYHVETY
jgi:benzoyl-CoA 2,3-dioxygenase component A